MAKLYRIEAIVPAKVVGPLMELLDAEGSVKLVTPLDDDAPAKRGQHARRAPKERTGLTGRQLVEQLIRESGTPGLSMTALQSAFESDGRAVNSVSPALSYLTRDGTVVRTSSDQFVHRMFVNKPAAVLAAAAE